MEPSSAQTIATFTGTLLRREQHPAKRLVQLVFREDDKNWLCVSTNLATAKLDVGKDYRIEGAFKQLGERPFIHEPSISLIKQRKLALKVGLRTGVAILLVGGVTAALSFIPSSNSAHYTTIPSQGSDSTVVQPNAAADDPSTAQATTSTSPTPAPVPAKTTSTKKQTTTTPSANNTVMTPATSSSPTPSPMPDPTPASDPGTTNPGTTDPGTPPPSDPGTVDPGTGTTTP